MQRQELDSVILVDPYQLRIFYDYDLNPQQKQFVLCGLAHLQHQNAVSLPAACNNHCAIRAVTSQTGFSAQLSAPWLQVLQMCYLQSFTEHICTRQGFKFMTGE